MVRLARGEGRRRGADLPDTVQALLAARLDSLRAIRAAPAPAGRGGAARTSGWGRSRVAREDGTTSTSALDSLQEKDLIMPSEGAQLAGEREFAFKHVLIRDVAYAMLPKAVRCRRHFEVGQLHRGAAPATAPTRSWRCSPSTTAAPPRSARRPACRASSSSRCTRRRSRFLEAAGDAAATLYSNAEAFDHYEAARGLRRRRRRRAARASPRSRATWRCGSVALTPRWRCGRSASSTTASQEDARARGRPAPQGRRGALAQGRVASRRSSTTSAGSTCSRTGRRRWSWCTSTRRRPRSTCTPATTCSPSTRPRRPCGWRSVWARRRAASRAHGIFGRVFGRIGDTAKARENLERSVELARDSSRTETIRALLALGDHLEISEADYEAADRIYTEALAARRAARRPAGAGRAAIRARRARRLPRRLGRGRGAHRVERSSSPSARGWWASSPTRTRLRGLLRWRRGDSDAAVAAYRRAHEMAEQVGWSEVAYSALFGLSLVLRDTGDWPAP